MSLECQEKPKLYSFFYAENKPELPTDIKPPKEMMDWIHKLLDLVHELEDKLEMHIGMLNDHASIFCPLRALTMQN